MHDDDQMFSCPYCDRRFRYKPELEGKRVRCKCGEKFAVEAPLIEEPDPYSLGANPDEEDDGPDLMALLGTTDGNAPVPVPTAGKACPVCGSAVTDTAALCIQCGTNLKSGKKSGKTSVVPGWASAHENTSSAVRIKITGAGLGLHGLGYLALVLGMTVAGVGGHLMEGGNPTGEVLAMIGGLATLGGLPLLVIGPFLGLAAPPDAGRGLLIGSIACYLGGTALVILLATGQVPGFLAAVASVPFLVGAGCFLGFLQKLSVYLDDDSLYSRSEFLLKTLFLIVILAFLVFIPLINCLALIAMVVVQPVFTIVYAWTVCQAALSALKT